MTTFIKIYTIDGGFYCVKPHHITLLDDMRRGKNVAEWLTMEFVESDTELYIRADEIQSYYLSTPESRRSAMQWAAIMNGEDTEPEEPWKM